MEIFLLLVLIVGGYFVVKHGAILITRHNLKKDPIMRRLYAQNPEYRKIFKLKEEPAAPPKEKPPEPEKPDTYFSGPYYPLAESLASWLYVIGYEKGINRSQGKHEKSYKYREEARFLNHFKLQGHLYVVGTTGIGKTKFLEVLIRQKIDARHGFGVIDPHGDLAEEIKAYLTCKILDVWKDEDKLNKELLDLFYSVVIIDPTKDPSVRFNPLEVSPGMEPERVAGELKAVFKKMWGSDSWGPRLENLLLNSFIALAETGHTLVDLPKFLTDGDFRGGVLVKVKNENCLMRLRQFHDTSEADRRQWAEPVLNKVDALLSDRRMRRLFSSKESTFNLRDIMDSGKVLLVKLGKGELGDNSDLLGSLLLTKLQLTAFSRSNVPKEERKPWTLFIDEFQNFATESFNVILSEARKYHLALVLSHQNLSQLPEKVQASILGNCWLHAYFRTSHQDAQVLAKEGLNVPFQDPDLAGEDYQPFKISYVEPKERAARIERLEKKEFIFRDKEEKQAYKLEAPFLADRSDILRKYEYLQNFADSFLGAGYFKYEDKDQANAGAAKSKNEPENEEEVFWEPKEK